MKKLLVVMICIVAHAGTGCLKKKTSGQTKSNQLSDVNQLSGWMVVSNFDPIKGPTNAKIQFNLQFKDSLKNGASGVLSTTRFTNIGPEVNNLPVSVRLVSGVAKLKTLNGSIGGAIASKTVYEIKGANTKLLYDSSLRQFASDMEPLPQIEYSTEIDQWTVSYATEESLANYTDFLLTAQDDKGETFGFNVRLNSPPGRAFVSIEQNKKNSGVSDLPLLHFAHHVVPETQPNGDVLYNAPLVDDSSQPILKGQIAGILFRENKPNAILIGGIPLKTLSLTMGVK